MSYIKTGYQATGGFSDWITQVGQDNLAFLKGVVSYATYPGQVARLQEERRLAEAADKAKADRERMEAARQVRIAEAERAQIAAAGGVMVPPPLTEQQRDVAVLLKERQLRQRSTLIKVAAAGVFGALGYFTWQAMR